MSSPEQTDTAQHAAVPPDRREFLSNVSSVAMGAGLVCGYGTLGVYAAQFLYPAKPTPKGFLYAVDISTMNKGDSFFFQTPAGDKVVIARHGDGDSVEDFIALSSTCPHLGCRVHWEPQNTRFFCPCHNGVFDPAGRPLEGPPASANTPLAQFNLQLAAGSNLLFIEVELESLTGRTTTTLTGGAAAQLAEHSNTNAARPS